MRCHAIARSPRARALLAVAARHGREQGRRSNPVITLTGCCSGRLDGWRAATYEITSDVPLVSRAHRRSRSARADADGRSARVESSGQADSGCLASSSACAKTMRTNAGERGNKHLRTRVRTHTTLPDARARARAHIHTPSVYRTPLNPHRGRSRSPRG